MPYFKRALCFKDRNLLSDTCLHILSAFVAFLLSVSFRMQMFLIMMRPNLWFFSFMICATYKPGSQNVFTYISFKEFYRALRCRYLLTCFKFVFGAREGSFLGGEGTHICAVAPTIRWSEHLFSSKLLWLHCQNYWPSMNESISGFSIIVSYSQYHTSMVSKLGNRSLPTLFFFFFQNYLCYSGCFAVPYVIF